MFSEEQKGLLRELGCIRTQVELVHCDLRAIPSSRCQSVLEELRNTSSCDQSFLLKYAQLGHRVASRWAAPLGKVGDVQECVVAWERVRKHILDTQKCHDVPAWLEPSLFAVHHQLRYSDLQNEFTTLLVALKALWVPSEEDDVWEARVQEHMPDIMVKVRELVSYLIATRDEKYIIEKALVPSMMLRFVGGGALGPTCYQWASFPFKSLGRERLWKARMTASDKAFSDACSRARAIMRPARLLKMEEDVAKGSQGQRER